MEHQQFQPLLGHWKLSQPPIFNNRFSKYLVNAMDMELEFAQQPGTATSIVQSSKSQNKVMGRIPLDVQDSAVGQVITNKKGRTVIQYKRKVKAPPQSMFKYRTLVTEISRVSTTSDGGGNYVFMEEETSNMFKRLLNQSEVMIRMEVDSSRTTMRLIDMTVGVTYILQKSV